MEFVGHGFPRNTPKEIETLMQELAATSSENDHSSSIRDRLKQILDLFKVSRYKLSPTGDLKIDEERLSRGGQANRSDRSRESGGTNRTGGSGGTAGSLYSLFLKADGIPGKLFVQMCSQKSNGSALRMGPESLGTLKIVQPGS